MSAAAGMDDQQPQEEDTSGSSSSDVRFEDLTVDDDLPIMDRVVRYTRSSIALQRLVHVKMLAETAALSGRIPTQRILVPAIANLLHDPESVIRQHLAAQLLPLAITCMTVLPPKKTVADCMENPELPHNRQYDARGYKMVCGIILQRYLQELIADAELDVRRAAADAITGLSLQIKPTDVETVCLPIPLQLLLTSKRQPPHKQRNDDSQQPPRANEEELRITAANLLAEMGGAASEYRTLQRAAQSWVQRLVLPAVAALCEPNESNSFRVRRCAAQAFPRLLGACTVTDAIDVILPAFDELSRDDIHRVRKAVGECLVDMSRAITILANNETDETAKNQLLEQRRAVLLPIAERLIQDNHKLVRQGMMQFLGPFIASFYPYQYSTLTDLLPSTTESDGSNHVGIVAQFFPHATSMVSRLNSSQNATTSAPTPVHSSLEQLTPAAYYCNPQQQQLDELLAALPTFLHAARMSAWSLDAVTEHRQQHPPAAADIDAVVAHLLDYFVALAAVNTGDENTNAEMRVYCAYSFPAIVLLLGKEHWEGPVRTCFHTLLNPRYPEEDDSDDDDDDEHSSEPPLPVKRCLASSLHTVAHILGETITETDIIGVVQNCFLTDSDDSVRLSTIRNFPALLKCLPMRQRREPFLLWSSVVLSDDMLGGGGGGGKKQRSATNPTVLNWRQRDYLARSLPELLLLIDPALIHKHIWPVIQQLLSDGVNVVRDDALWAIPVLLKQYCADTLAHQWPHITAEHAKKFSAEACLEVITWIREEILKVGKSSSSSRTNKQQAVANFSDRQLYCRICAALGLALRFGQGECSMDSLSASASAEKTKYKDPVSVLSDKFKSFFFANKSNNSTEMNGPYQRLSVAEQRHLKKILMDDLLPLALSMKEDRISNVRITLMKGLQIMPADVREHADVKSVLKDLQEESETWTSFGAEEPPLIPPPQAHEIHHEQHHHHPSDQESSSGPVDVDNVHVTPHGSSDEDDEEEEDDGQEEEEEYDDNDHLSGLDEEVVSDMKIAAAAAAAVQKEEEEDNESDSSDSVATESEPPPPPPRPKQQEKKAAEPHHHSSSSSSSALKKVLFEAGSIGMQLEPTADDTGCRVCGFLDSDDGTPSPARASGKIQIGDVIVKVNQHHVKSYDNTISILKAGGRRKITFRPGRPEDVQYDEGDAANGNASDDDHIHNEEDEAEDSSLAARKREKAEADAKAKKEAHAAAKRHHRREKTRKEDKQEKEKKHKKHKKEKKVKKEKKKESN